MLKKIAVGLVIILVSLNVERRNYETIKVFRECSQMGNFCTPIFGYSKPPSEVNKCPSSDKDNPIHIYYCHPPCKPESKSKNIFLDAPIDLCCPLIHPRLIKDKLQHGWCMSVLMNK